MIAGAAVGLGLVAFMIGFQAQRAQYALAQAPLVFVDYWSCAEVGAVAVLDSLQIAVQSPGLIFGLIALSVAIFLLLESGRFRTVVLRPIPNFICLLGLLASLLLTLRQQLTPLALTEATATASAGPRDSVPTQWPFTALIPARAELPAGEEFYMPSTSVEAWNDIARHVEDTHVEQARYLLLRPRPLWARAPADMPGDASEDFLGVAVPDAGLDESRALSLFAVIVKASTINLWVLLFSWLWNRRILNELQAGHEVLPAGRWRRLVYLLREEFWYCSGVILIPIAAFLTLCSGMILPSNYGMLASTRLGQEYAEVFVRGQSVEASPDPAKALDGALASDEGPGAADVFEGAADLAYRYGLADSVHDRHRAQAEWEQLITRIERERTPAAAEMLQRIAQMAAPLAPPLAEKAQQSWLRSAVSTTTRRSGYILHYPRSEQVLRILEVDQTSGSGWSVLPIPMDRVLEIHVQGRQKDRSLATLLRQMDGSNDGERTELLLEVLRLGHGLTLEVFLAAMRDKSPQIRGDAVTRVGVLASNLGIDPLSELRRRRTQQLLIEFVRDEGTRVDVRGAAVTSLGRLARPHDPAVCAVFLQLLRDARLNGSDTSWELRGTAITGLGALRCEEGTEILGSMLTDPHVPTEARGAIPAALLMIGDEERTVAVLSALIRDPKTRLETLWPAIGTLGSVRGSATPLSVVTLCEFLGELQRRDLGNLPRELLQELALSALHHLGDRQARPTLERLAQDRAVKEEMRVLALTVLKDLASPESQEMLLALGENGDEPERVRARAIQGLSEFADDQALLRLHTLYQAIESATPRSPLLGVIRKTLHERASGGAGLASYLLRVVRSRPAVAPEKPGEAGDVTAKIPAPFLSTRVVHTSDDEFVDDCDRMPMPVLLMAWAPWCPACKATIPTFEKLAAEYDGKVQFMAVNVDDNQALGTMFSSIPSFVLIGDAKHNRKTLGQSKGQMSESEMRKFLQAAISPS